MSIEGAAFFVDGCLRWPWTIPFLSFLSTLTSAALCNLHTRGGNGQRIMCCLENCQPWDELVFFHHGIYFSGAPALLYAYRSYPANGTGSSVVLRFELASLACLHTQKTGTTSFPKRHNGRDNSSTTAVIEFLFMELKPFQNIFWVKFEAPRNFSGFDPDCERCVLLL